MHRAPKKTAARLLGLALVLALVSTHAVAQNRHQGARIQVAPPRLALLARHLDRLGVSASWDFASITLDVLLDSYHRELDRAARERSSTAERRAKLYRWQHATSQLAAQIRAARLRLLDGASFSVYADPQHQVLIIVDGQPISVSGPRPNADREIEEQVIALFCAYNDCSPIESESAQAAPSAREAGGSWILGQDMLPTFEIHGVIRCTFTDITERQRKARACRRAADEALALATAMRQAQGRGYRIDWDWLAIRPPSHTSTGQVAVNTDGAYLELPTDMLVRVSRTDWQGMVAWLRPDGDNRERILALEQADSLLD